MGWYLGSNGNDNLIGTAGIDYIFGVAGNDLITGGAGGDSLSGGAGIDTLLYIGSSAGVTVDLTSGEASGGDAEGDIFSGFENIVGSSYNDTLIGDTGANTLSGGAGNDALYGSWGNDALYGGSGQDQLMGGVGADYLDGGSGSDYADYSGSYGSIIVNLALGWVSGGDAQGDVYVSIENVRGSELADLIGGDDGANSLAGRAGNDALWGFAGDDGLGGGVGDDILNGGAGSDTLRGDSGNDTFVFASISDSLANVNGPFVADTIMDFDDGVWNDVIDLSAIDANETAGGDQAFFLDNGNGAMEAGELFITDFAENDDPVVTIMFADVNGDAVADFGVKFYSVIHTLDATDFVL
jgi:Ca2+-binding RTX toxin-like protein